MKKLIMLSVLIYACISVMQATEQKFKDNIDIPFVNDPQVLGSWKSIDLVSEIKDFSTKNMHFEGKLQLDELIFDEYGYMPGIYHRKTWTKGYVLDHKYQTASKYTIEKIGKDKYMFYEWKTGDYIYRGMKPRYYVLKKMANLRKDNIDMPFKNEPSILGCWACIDYVTNPKEFDPEKDYEEYPCPKKDMLFLEGGKILSSGYLGRWTKGFVLHGGNKTASKYFIRKIKGKEYMFREHKSGDYSYRGKMPNYYVLKRAKTKKPDNIDVPFVDDPQVIGTWVSVDFVSYPSIFHPKRRVFESELYLKKLVFLKNGKFENFMENWTKGFIVSKQDKMVSRYEIRDIDSEKYMFFEWKTDIYTCSDEEPYYYVLKKIK